MGNLMRCIFCGLLQDEPVGVKTCDRCGGELVFEKDRIKAFSGNSYLSIQMELDQIFAPSERVVDRYVLLTIQSPKEVPENFKSKEYEHRPPVNFNPVLDRSGSMHGKKIEFVRKAILESTKYLKSGDSFSFVVYNNEATSIFDSQVITEKYLDRIREAASAIKPGGSTALHAGLELGIQQSKKIPKASNLILLLSDGLANVGITDLEIIGQSAKKARLSGAVITTIGVGHNYNEALLTEVSAQGGGRFYHIDDPNQIPNFIAGELGEAANWAAKDLKIHLTLPDGASGMALSDAFPVAHSNNMLTVSVGNIPCDTNLEIPVRISFSPQPAGEKLTISSEFAHGTPSGKILNSPINTVSLRIVESQSFLPNNGVVEPVLYRVLQQRKASSLINIKRAMFSRSRDAFEEEKQSVHELRDYASRLGEKRAQKEISELDQHFSDLHGPSHQSKMRIHDSFTQSRGQKDFRK